MAEPRPSEVFTQLVTATDAYRFSKPADNVTDHNAGFAWMREHGNIRQDVDGGDEIRMPVEYAENDSIIGYSGWQPFDQGENEFLTSAKYDWKQKVGTVKANGYELRTNRGKARLINLAKAKKTNMRHSIANHMATEFYGDGTAAGAYTGLDGIITDDGMGTVGGIDSTAASGAFWRSQVESVAGNSGDLIDAYNSIILKLTRGVDKPDLFLSTHDHFNTIRRFMQERSRYTGTMKAHLGFDALSYEGGIPIVHDQKANFGTSDSITYCLNTKHLFMVEHPQAQWNAEAPRTPVDQDGVVVPYLWMGEMVTNARFLQGKVIA